MKNKHNVEDIRDENGDWVMTYVSEGVKHNTRASVLWSNIKKRTKFLGEYQVSNKTYIGCENRFTNFQEFAGWCQCQKGYYDKNPNGTYWHLDKDLLGLGYYGKDSCVFIPQEINALFTNVRKNKEFPLGTWLDYRIGKFVAQGIQNGKRTTLGRFLDPLIAHKVWQIAKVDTISNLVLKWQDLVDARVVESLLTKSMHIQEDIDLNRETKSL